MGELFSTLLFPLLGGYVLSVSLLELRYHSLKLNGYLLILQCTVFGLVLYFFSHLAIYGINCFFDYLQQGASREAWISKEDSAKDAWNVLRSPLDNLGDKRTVDAAFLSIIFSLFISAPCLLFEYSRPSYKKKRELALSARQGGRAAQIIRDSLNNEKPIVMTLHSKKVYIGVVTEIPAFIRNISRHALRFTPLASGYRSADKLDVHITQDYELYTEALSEFKGMSDEEKYLNLLSGDETEYVFSKEDLDYLQNTFSCYVFWDEIESLSYWTQLPYSTVSPEPTDASSDSKEASEGLSHNAH